MTFLIHYTHLFSIDEPKAKIGKTEAPNVTDISIRRTYPDLYRKIVNDPDERASLFQKVKDEENIYRELFAQERDSKELSDPHALLIDVHENKDIFE